MDELGRVRVPDPARIEAELQELWRRAPGEGEAVLRACTLNLVVICAPGEDDGLAATRLVARLSEVEPGRALVVVEPDSPSGDLEVYVSAHCHRGAYGSQVCSEQITLRVGGGGAHLVPGTILQLLVEDMPVYTWWRRDSLDGELADALRDLSHGMIVDSARFADATAAWERLRGLARRTSSGGFVADLGWVAIEPWREALASMFDPPSSRAHLAALTAIEIGAGGEVGVRGAAAYLAGWLTSRLGLTEAGERGVWRRTDGGPVACRIHRDDSVASGRIASVRLEVAHASGVRAFVARRDPPGGDLVRLSIEAEPPGTPPYCMRIPQPDEAELACRVLQRQVSDRAFLEALDHAARIG